jgi:putative FmdB family regulatory protein
MPGVLVVPIYEYRCESCEHRLEKLQKMSEGDLVDCPECQRPALKRLVSAAAFRLKGGGWYETDFKKDNKRNLADSSGSEASGKGSSDGKSSTGDSAKTEKSSTESGAKKPETKSTAKSASKE